MKELLRIAYEDSEGHLQYPTVRVIKQAATILGELQKVFLSEDGTKDRFDFRSKMMNVFDFAKRNSYPHLLALAELGLKGVELSIKSVESLHSPEDRVYRNLALNMPHRLLLLTETVVGAYFFLRNARHIFDTQVGGGSAEIFTRALGHEDSEAVDAYHLNKVGGFGIIGLQEDIRGVLIAGLDNTLERIQNPHGKELLGSVLTKLHQRIKK